MEEKEHPCDKINIVIDVLEPATEVP